MRRGRRDGRSPGSRAAAASAVLALVVFVAMPALGNVDFQIVGFGEQDCFDGTDNLRVRIADPFMVEACVSDDGVGVEGVALVADIAHADDTSEAIDLITGEDGSVLFEVVPRDAGTTTVRMCLGSLDGDCDFGVLTFQASDPPSPPQDPTYLGPTVDIGLTDFVVDDSLYFFDPYTGGPADDGLGDPRMDIFQFRYLGNADGPARYEIVLAGDGCLLFADPDYPYAEFTMNVVIPGDQQYFLGYRVTQGQVARGAFSNGVPIDAFVDLESCDGDTAVLSATNVDVPEGSVITVRSWYRDDLETSGLQDYAEGPMIAAVVDVPDDGTTDGGSTDGGTTDGGSTDDGSSIDDDSSLDVAVGGDSDEPGGFPVPLLIFGVVAVAGGGYFAWSRFRRPPTEVLDISVGTAVATYTITANPDLLDTPSDGSERSTTPDLTLAAAPDDAGDAPLLDDATLLRISAEDAQWELEGADYERWKFLTGYVEGPEDPGGRSTQIASTTPLFTLLLENPDSSWDDASLRRLSKEEAEWELDPLDYRRWTALTGHVELIFDPEFPSERPYPIASAPDLSAPLFPSLAGDDGLVGDSDEITIGEVTVDLSGDDVVGSDADAGGSVEFLDDGDEGGRSTLDASGGDSGGSDAGRGGLVAGEADEITVGGLAMDASGGASGSEAAGGEGGTVELSDAVGEADGPSEFSGEGVEVPSGGSVIDVSGGDSGSEAAGGTGGTVELSEAIDDLDADRWGDGAVEASGGDADGTDDGSGGSIDIEDAPDDR